MFWHVATCRTLEAPSDANISCVLGNDGVPSYEDSCTFICDSGYILTGSYARTCQSDGRWSGTESACTKSMKCVSVHTYVCVLVYVCEKKYGNWKIDRCHWCY